MRKVNRFIWKSDLLGQPSDSKEKLINFKDMSARHSKYVIAVSFLILTHPVLWYRMVYKEELVEKMCEASPTLAQKC